MTYFELIDKAYDYLINEDIEGNLEQLNLTNAIPIEMLKGELKKAKIFLNLYYQKQRNILPKKNEKLLTFLDFYFTENIPDIQASIEATITEDIKKNIKLLEEDELCSDMLEMLQEMDLPETEQKYFIYYLIGKYIQNLETNGIEHQIITKVFYSSINNALDYIKETLMELLYTEKGKKYINNPFWIEDKNKRKKAKQYVQKIVDDINDNETLSRVKDYNQWTKHIIEMAPLLKQISEIPNGLDNLISMDNYLEQEFHFIYKDVPLLILLNNYKEEQELNLSEEIKYKLDSKIIELFFSNESKLTLEEKTLLLVVYYYGGTKENVYEDINDNFDRIIDIMHSDINKYKKENEIKKISKILK